jgi:regulator of cell morphogenesis and NO signaling
MSTEEMRFAERAVGEVAASLPGATAVFRRHKLDFCCGGHVALKESAVQRGADLDAIERELAALERALVAKPVPEETEALIGHILARYHEAHRRELPELVKLARKVEAVHAAHPAAPLGLADTLAEMAGELEMHMKKEELILFPAMARALHGMLDAPILQMRSDHDAHRLHLRRLESLTNGFTLPDGACRSWQALYAGAAKLVDDLMEHIHLENNVLFPRFESAQARAGQERD